MSHSEAPMSQFKQLTLRDFDEPLAERISEYAREHDLSLSRAVMALLRHGAGLSEESPYPSRVDDEFDELIGIWTDEQEREFLDALEPLNTIDDEIWS